VGYTIVHERGEVEQHGYRQAGIAEFRYTKKGCEKRHSIPLEEKTIHTCLERKGTKKGKEKHVRNKRLRTREDCYSCKAFTD
jgi:hypothetical protein